MTCRHRSGDPDCSITQMGYQVSQSETPDAEKYCIEELVRLGPHVVLKVRYPNCRNCAYEGCKVMVFLNVTELQMLNWRRIDPHFRAFEAGQPSPIDCAPSPAARFPASQEGWADALAYAKVKAVET